MINELFLKVLSISISASLIILLVITLRFFLKKSPKIYSYVLWLVVLIKLITPFTFQSDFSFLDRVNNNVENTIINDFGNISTFINSYDNLYVDKYLMYDYSIGNQSEPLANNVQKKAISILSIISIIWVFGVVFFSIYVIYHIYKLKRKVAYAKLYKDNIYFSDNIETAFVFGVNPKIYLPCWLKDNEIEYIILHEKIHIKRLDHISRILSFLVVIVHWFNPLVWVSLKLSAKDMEMSCDESVLKKLGNSVKKDYSSSLLLLATNTNNFRITPLAFNENDTESRVKNILKYKKPKFILVVVSIIIVIIASIFSFFRYQDNNYIDSDTNNIDNNIDVNEDINKIDVIDENTQISQLESIDASQYNNYMEYISNFDGFKPYYYIRIDNTESYFSEKVKSFYNELKGTIGYTNFSLNTVLRYGSKNPDYKNGEKFVYTYSIVGAEQSNNEPRINSQTPTLSGEDYFVTGLKTATISQEISKEFDKNIESGRNFTDEDFILSSNSDYISVILGSGYKDIYKLNDIIVLDLYNVPMNFKVIGFYEENTMFYVPIPVVDKFIEFNYYITIPSVILDYQPVGEVEILQHKSLVDEIMQGLIPINEPIAEVKEDTYLVYMEQVKEIEKKYSFIKEISYPSSPLGFIWNVR